MEKEIVASAEEKSFLSVIVHSFFIIPFLIAVFCLLLLAGMHLLTREQKNVYDYLEDIKIGSLTKRWQGAFELSKILASPELLPVEERFNTELIGAFVKARHDDPRVRQYLALAIGRTGRVEFTSTLIHSLSEELEENVAATLYALGMLKDPTAIPTLIPYVTHAQARIRSMAVVALGSIGSTQAQDILRQALLDSEANVRWGAAVALAGMHDASGATILEKMLNRNYWNDFPAVDAKERVSLMLAAIDGVAQLNDTNLHNQLKELSQSATNMKVRSRALAVVAGPQL